MAPKGERNGFRETPVDTPVGPITYPRQRLVNAPGFRSKIHTPYMRRPEEFATAVTEMYVGGVSTRKVKRGTVEGRYAALIAALYDGSRSVRLTLPIKYLEGEGKLEAEVQVSDVGTPVGAGQRVGA